MPKDVHQLRLLERGDHLPAEHTRVWTQTLRQLAKRQADLMPLSKRSPTIMVKIAAQGSAGSRWWEFTEVGWDDSAGAWADRDAADALTHHELGEAIDPSGTVAVDDVVEIAPTWTAGWDWVWMVVQAGSGDGAASSPTFLEITGATATGVVDALGNDVQWEYDAKPIERGAEVMAGTTGLTWTESTKALSKTGAFAGYTFLSGDVVVIAATGGVAAGEYVIESRTDDDELILRESITGGSDATGVELTRIKRYSGYGAWADAVGTTVKAYNHFERDNDGSGRQMNGIDHDGAAYPAGFQMRPIQTGVIVRAEIYEIALANGTTRDEAWFAHPNAEDGTCT